MSALSHSPLYEKLGSQAMSLTNLWHVSGFLGMLINLFTVLSRGKLNTPSAIPWGFLEGAARAGRGYVVLSSHSRSVAQEEEIQQCFLGGLVIHATYLFSYTVPSLSDPAVDKFDSQIQLVLAFVIKAPWRRTGSMDSDRA